MEVSAAVSAFGVMFGMSIPMLNLPTAFIAALGLVLVPKLAESTALGRKAEARRRISKAMLGASVLMLPAMAFLVVLGPTLGAALFQEPTVGDFLTPLSAGVVLSCYQSVLSCSLNGGGAAARRRPKRPCSAERWSWSSSSSLWACPGWGFRGYVLAALASALLGVVLGAVGLYRAVGLRPELFRWLTAPGLAALLMGLNVNLLFRVLRDRGLSGPWSAAACLVLGSVLYLAALSAQGVWVGELFPSPPPGGPVASQPLCTASGALFRTGGLACYDRLGPEFSGQIRSMPGPIPIPTTFLMRKFVPG